jgi:hypothetical protein
MFKRPYSARDICEALDISLDTLYRTRQLRHGRDGLPRPISERGPLKWERTGFDAWLTRHHPQHPPRPANDVAAVPDPASIEESQARLALAYGTTPGRQPGRD